MSKHVPYSLISRPHLIDIVDESWQRERLPLDGAPGLRMQKRAHTGTRCAMQCADAWPALPQVSHCRQACNRLVRNLRSIQVQLQGHSARVIVRGSAGWTSACLSCDSFDLFCADSHMQLALLQTNLGVRSALK